MRVGLPGVVVMGVSGAGKSTIGPLLAAALGMAFADADAFHSAANIAKMSAGTPLTDEDRWPWIDAIGARMASNAAEGRPLVVACSALKRAYRDRLRTAVPGLRFVYLEGSKALIGERLEARNGHFMPAGLLDSQFAALEDPTAEAGVVAAPIGAEPPSIVALACRELLENG